MARRTVPIRVHQDLGKLLRKVAREQSKIFQRQVTVPELSLAIFYHLTWESGESTKWWSEKLIQKNREEVLRQGLEDRPGAP